MLSAAGMGKTGGPNSGYAVFLLQRAYPDSSSSSGKEKYSFKRIGDDYNDIEEEWDGDDDSIRYKTQIEIELSIDPPGVLLSTSKLLGI